MSRCGTERTHARTQKRDGVVTPTIYRLGRAVPPVYKPLHRAAFPRGAATHSILIGGVEIWLRISVKWPGHRLVRRRVRRAMRENRSFYLSPVRLSASGSVTRVALTGIALGATY